MHLQCPKCGKTCEIDFEPVVGQHIICPFCGIKFSYGEGSEDVGRKGSVDDQPKTVMAVCPYCGFAESVDEQYTGHVGACSKCHGEFTIMPNARGIPFQPQNPVVQESQGVVSASSSDGVLGFLLGLILGILGVLLAVLIDKKKYLKGSLYGLVANIVVGFLLVVLFTGMSQSIGRKTAGATEALSAEEGYRARSAAESISEDSIKSLGD